MRIGLGLALMATAAGRILACSCATPGTPCAAAGRASAVFTGTVLGITEPVWQQPAAIPGRAQASARRTADSPAMLPRPLRTVRIQVGDVLSGVAGGQKEIEIATGNGGGDCGYDFQVGVAYVVYAYKDADGRLETGICSRTRRVTEAAEDVAYIRGMAGAPDTGELRVRTRYGNVPAKAGLAITVERDGARYPALTNAAGEAVFAGLAAGEYRIHADRDGELADDPKVELHAKGCVDVTLLRALRINGRVMQRNGEPAGRIEVEVRSAEGVPGSGAMTDPEGWYQLRIMEPGRYYLGINLNHSALRDTPYPRWFYPGTQDMAGAVTIDFAGRPEVRTMDFTLPERQAERVVEGVVSRRDGRPLPRVVVSIVDTSGMAVAQGIADQSGRFSLQVFAGTAYRLHAVWPGNGMDAAMSAAPVAISAGTEALSLRLTLNQPGNSYLDEQRQADATRR